MTEIRITDPKTGAQKGQKLERYDLIPFDALDELARVYGVGAQKYADRNWEKGYAWGLSLGALCRHVAWFVRGESIDPETGCHHLAHAAWHCLALITFGKRGLGTDDRSETGKAAYARADVVTISMAKEERLEGTTSPRPKTSAESQAWVGPLVPPDFDPRHPGRGC